MSGRPTDDELRGMLDARASRVSPDTAREAMAGLRATLHNAPDGRGGFAVPPVAIGSRGARLPGGIVVVGLVAVILVAAFGSRLTAPQEAASGGVAGTAAPASAGADRSQGATSAPSPAPIGTDLAISPDEALPASWSGPDLGQALADRSAVGQVVVVEGPLTMRLCTPGATCQVDIGGLTGVRVDFPHPPSKAVAIVGSGAQTAFRIRDDGALDYLGEPDADPLRQRSVGALARGPSSAGLGSYVTGWLVHHSGWAITDIHPLSRGPFGAGTSLDVELADGFQPASGIADHPSTFLVSGTGGGWQVNGIVIAIIKPDIAETSSTPSLAPSSTPTSGGPPVISLPGIGTTLSPDDLPSRLADGSLDGRIVVIEGELEGMYEPCPSVYGCFALVLPGGSVVSIDADPMTSAELEHRLPGPGELVFVASHGVLNYLGPEPPDVDHPISVAELMTFPQSPNLMLVSGWLVRTGPMFCALIEPGGTPCPSAGPWLTDDHPARSGALASGQGIAVSLMETPVPVEPDALVTEGPFLVRGTGSSCAPLPGAQPAGGQPAACPLLPRILWEIVGLLGPTSPQRSALP